MKIEVPEVDARSEKGCYDVIDADSSLVVGFLEFGPSETGPAPKTTSIARHLPL
jgi:hypothetical protein